MRNIPEQEREKIMMGGGFRGDPEEQREQEKVQELSEQTGLSEQELIRLKTTTPQRVFYIVVGIVLLLSFIMYNLGANVFHWW